MKRWLLPRVAIVFVVTTAAFVYRFTLPNRVVIRNSSGYSVQDIRMRLRSFNGNKVLEHELPSIDTGKIVAFRHSPPLGFASRGSSNLKCQLRDGEWGGRDKRPALASRFVPFRCNKKCLEIMKRPSCTQPQGITRCCFTLTMMCLLAGATLAFDPSARSFAAQVESKTSRADATTQDELFSGPQPGEKVRPFKVLHIVDDEARESEIVNEADERATLICFVHKLSNDDRVLYGLGLVDFYASKHEELTSHFVLLSDDRYKMTEMLRGWAKGSLFTKSLVSLSVDGQEGPGQYGLNRSVAMTVVVAKSDQVVSNLVFNAPNNRDLQAIMAAVAKSLGEPEPKLAEVQQELRAERQRLADMKIKASPVFALAPDEQPGRIMYGMVHARGNQSVNANRCSQQLIEWVGDNKERKTLLKAYCKAVLEGDFDLNRYSREAIETLANDQD